MKKIGVFVFLLFFGILLITPGVLSTNHTNNDTNSSDDDSGTSNSGDSDSDKIENGFQCLEDKVGDCSGLTVQEISYTILSTPDNVFDSCVSELESQKSGDNWGNVKDTSLAILALQHAGKDTSASEAWIIDQALTPEDLVWYLQQDSNSPSTCNIGYDSESYVVSVGENKKFDKDAGPCLTRSQSSFWLEVDSTCYNKDFKIQCDADFAVSLLYKNKNSPVMHVLEGTQNAPAFEDVSINVISKCFGDSSCDYETTSWATVALLKTRHDISEYVPYLMALSETQKRYLPDAFIYMITNYQDYAAQLMEDRRLGNYWEAENSAYNKFYDTALALISLEGSSASQIKDSKDWLLFSQPTSGCWQDSIRDTAMVLWALTTRQGRSSSGGTTTCSSGGFFCIPRSDCPSGERLDNYYCSSISTTCCETENLKSCSEYLGEVCSGDEVCIGNERDSSDSPACCTGNCEVPEDTNECESNLYSCKSSCSDEEESIGYSCDTGSSQICCKTKSSEDAGLGTVWIITILILIVMGILGWILRDKLKIEWFKIKSKFKKDKGGNSSIQGGGPGIPPKPGFPPIRRVPNTRTPMKKPSQNPDSLPGTFDKLKSMSR